MEKLKRTVDGQVYDCTIVEGRVSYNWDDARVDLFAVYFDGVKWNRESLINFVPAKSGVDY